MNAQQQLIKDIQRTLGDIDQVNVPMSLKPTLQQLLQSEPNLDLIHQALNTLRQGWSNVGWFSHAEQNDCYGLYWGLKTALERFESGSAGTTVS